MEINDICFEIENDEFYGKFLTETVKPIADVNLSVSDQIAKLTKGIETLNSNLEKQVLLKHHDLLTQANHATNLESVLSSVQLHVQSLLSGAEKLRSKVLTPYSQLESNITMLERVQTTCHIMRHAAKIIVLSKNLNVDMEPVKQASLLYEIGEYINDRDFTGIDLLDNILGDVKMGQSRLLNNSKVQLEDSLLSGDKTKLLESFKIFQNMHCTLEQINQVIKNILDDLTREMRKAFSVQPPTMEYRRSNSSRAAPGKANIMNTQDFKQKFWENVEKLFINEMYDSCLKVIMLQNVLNELNTIGNFRGIARKFWDDLSISLQKELEACPITINQCVEIDFPKLLMYYNDLVSKLKCKDFILKRETLVRWENAFLSKTLGKLLDPVRTMWHLSQIPNTDQIDSAVRVISSALSVALCDKQLSISLAHSVAKCIKQMNVESEQRMCMDSDVAQIIEAPTTSQQRNADLCNCLYYFVTQINRVLTNMSSNLPSESVEIVQNSLKDISSLPALQLFASSIKAALELILLTIHNEDDLRKNDDPTGRNLSCCLYMKELQQFIARCKVNYFTMFNDTPAVTKCCNDIAARCIDKFIQHVCTVRPLTKYGRIKLALDCKQMEEALSPIVPDIAVLGTQYRQLRALHSLLEMGPSEILKSQSEGASVPYSLVMMLLFSHAGSELVAPHACVNWTIQKLMQWLDIHQSEKERLDFVAGALQRYQNHVRQNNIANYDEVYPVLMQMYENGQKYSF